MLKWVGQCCKRELRRLVDRFVLAIVVFCLVYPFVYVYDNAINSLPSKEYRP